jgi:Tfp pilus assembly protein PilX
MKPSSVRNQTRGFALITALLLLIGLMLLGISGMTTSIFDEKLAGNFAHRNVTYQLAEAALRAGEFEALQVVNGRTFENPAPHQIPRQATGTTADAFKTLGWSTGKSVNVPGMRSSQSVNYFIEEIAERINDSDGLSRINFQYLRVTARATDAVNGSSTVLQSVVRRIRED